MTYLTGMPSRILTLLFVAAFISGCTNYAANNYNPAVSAPTDTDLVRNSYNAAEQLLGGSQVPLSKDRPILVASLVSVANLESSSNLGRIVSEQITSRLVQLGYATREMKFRGSFLVRKGGGQFVLSRQVQAISKKQEAQAVITGVYAVARNGVYVTLRLIRAEDSTVISSYDYRLPMGPDMVALLDPFGRIDY